MSERPDRKAMRRQRDESSGGARSSPSTSRCKKRTPQESSPTRPAPPIATPLWPQVASEVRQPIISHLQPPAIAEPKLRLTVHGQLVELRGTRDATADEILRGVTAEIRYSKTQRRRRNLIAKNRQEQGLPPKPEPSTIVVGPVAGLTDGSASLPSSATDSHPLRPQVYNLWAVTEPAPSTSGRQIMRKKSFIAGAAIREHNLLVDPSLRPSFAERTLVRLTEERICPFFTNDRRPYEVPADAHIRTEMELSDAMLAAEWRVLKANQQTVALSYYEIQHPARTTSETIVRAFYCLDTMLIWTFRRMTRARYDALFDNTEIGPWHATWPAWAKYYEEAIKNDLDDPEREKLWADLSFAISVTYVLRRAFDEEPFRRMLLRLGPQTEMTASCMVLGSEYGKVLKYVRSALTSTTLPSHEYLIPRMLIGDSMISRFNVRPESQVMLREYRRAKKDYDDRMRKYPRATIPLPRKPPVHAGIIRTFRIFGISGASTAVVSWLTQAMQLSQWQDFAWFVGTNDTNRVPVPSKDDRSPERLAEGIPRFGDKGKLVQENYTWMVFGLMYHARLNRRVNPQYGTLGLFEVLPRYSDCLGSYSDLYQAWLTADYPPPIEQNYRMNSLLGEFLQAHRDERLFVLHSWQKANHPFNFRDSKTGQITLHIKTHTLQNILNEELHRVTYTEYDRQRQHPQPETVKEPIILGTGRSTQPMEEELKPADAELDYDEDSA